jgi:hypothetical protein
LEVGPIVFRISGSGVRGFYLVALPAKVDFASSFGKSRFAEALDIQLKPRSAAARQEKAPLPEMGVEAGQGAITPPLGRDGATKSSHIGDGGEIKDG